MRALSRAWIIGRRMVAVLLVPVLVLVFALSLVTGRLNDTVLDPGFLKTQLRELRFYDRFHDEAVPDLVQGFVDDQRERLPENLDGIDLPTDPTSVERISGLVQTLLPSDYVQREVEQAIDAMVPWLAGERDDFALTLSMHDNVEAVFGHPVPGEASLFEQTWRDIDLGERVLNGLVSSTDGSSVQGGGAAPGGAEATPLELLRADTPGAVAWLEGNLFGSIDDLLPFLTGDAPHFAFRITFDEFPYLADGFASVLHEDAATLRRDGWGFTDSDLREALDQSEQEFVANADETFAIVRPQGLTVTSDDLLDRIEREQEQRRLEHDAALITQGRSPDAAPFDPGLDPRQVHNFMRTWRIPLTWGPVALAVRLLAGIGFLGGRQWWSRLLWASAALLVASTMAFTATGIVYGRTAGRVVDDYVAEQRALPASHIPADLRDALLDQLEATSDGIARHMSDTSRNWLIVALGGIVGAVALRLYRRSPGEPYEALEAANEGEKQRSAA